MQQEKERDKDRRRLSKQLRHTDIMSVLYHIFLICICLCLYMLLMYERLCQTGDPVMVNHRYKTISLDVMVQPRKYGMLNLSSLLSMNVTLL